MDDFALTALPKEDKSAQRKSKIFEIKYSMKVLSSAWRPGIGEATRLFATGSIVGPLVDSLHNQCLLEYGIAPIFIDNPFNSASSGDHLIASSWLVPPLLGVAYVVLGGLLPRFAQVGIDRVAEVTMAADQRRVFALDELDTSKFQQSSLAKSSATQNALTIRAVVAVVTTALLIKLSSILEITAVEHGKELLVALALLQWLILDRSFASLIVAAVASLGGPLAELPFVGHHAWTYLPAAGDYFPLHGIMVDGKIDSLFRYMLGDNYQNLALASITMDAIACGRAFAAVDNMADGSG